MQIDYLDKQMLTKCLTLCEVERNGMLPVAAF